MLVNGASKAYFDIQHNFVGRRDYIIGYGISAIWEMRIDQIVLNNTTQKYEGINNFMFSSMVAILNMSV